MRAPLSGWVAAEFRPGRHQARHLGLGDVDFAAAPIGQVDVLDGVVLGDCSWWISFAGGRGIAAPAEAFKEDIKKSAYLYLAMRGPGGSGCEAIAGRVTFPAEPGDETAMIEAAPFFAIADADDADALKAALADAPETFACATKPARRCSSIASSAARRNAPSSCRNAAGNRCMRQPLPATANASGNWPPRHPGPSTRCRPTAGRRCIWRRFSATVRRSRPCSKPAPARASSRAPSNRTCRSMPRPPGARSARPSI